MNNLEEPIQAAELEQKGGALAQDDPSLEDYNVKSRVDDFVKAALDQAGLACVAYGPFGRRR